VDTAGNPVVVDGSHVTGYLGEELHYFEKDYCHSVVVGSKSYYSFVHSHNFQSSPGSLSIYLAFFPNAFVLDLFGFGVSTFPPGAAGAMFFHDPLEGTETNKK